MKAVCSILLLFCIATMQAQQGFTFTRFSTDDNTGIASNAISSLYQDDKGYIWVGTANGLQRFDGSKFIQFGLSKNGNDYLPFSAVTQIMAVDSGKLLLNYAWLREIGVFDPVNFSYKKIPVRLTRPVSPRAGYEFWKDFTGEVYMNVSQYGVLHYDKKQGAFVETNFFHFPEGYVPSPNGVYDDEQKKQVWFVGDKGLCIYDRQSKQTWYRNYNPQQLPILKNEVVQDRSSEIFIDSKRRIWIFGWPKNTSVGQVKYCLDSTGSRYLQKDTIGLTYDPHAYTEYTRFYEKPRSGLWIYGLSVLLNQGKESSRFYFTPSTHGSSVNTIEYGIVNQILEDRDGNIWVATDKGLYFTSYSSGSYSVINYLFQDKGEQTSITDMIEMPHHSFWFATWGKGILELDSQLKASVVPVYKQQPPASWPAMAKSSVALTWAIWQRRHTNEMWVGCNYGVLFVYDLQTKTTRYLFPPEANHSTIRYITEDAQGALWISTQGGRLLKWSAAEGFTVVQDIGTIIYKIFFDKEGLIWLATHEKGLYCLDASGKLLKQYRANGTLNGLYSDAGQDIEQLNDSTIVFGAGALNFINKRSGAIRQLRYEDGMPSNSVYRLRMDDKGFLWMITSNGLSLYNPFNNHVTTYGRRDGVTLAEQTVYADLYSSSKYIMFAGDNAVFMFKPSVFAATQAPPDVVLTDFKIFNQFVPLDSMLQLPHIRLGPDQNSFSIYFSSLSYQQRDRLTYYFKMDGIDKDWIAADGINSQNYSLLPPGDYLFNVYAVNAEGLRSSHTTQLRIIIRPHFWRTRWFMATLVFLILLVIYFLHKERVNRLLAVEKLRTRVARDLHDDMGSTLSTINILSAMAKSKMNTDAVKTAGYLSKISDNSQRMMEAMDDIVWSIKPSNDSMQRITARMREFATSVLEAKDMALQFSVAEEVTDVKLNMEARRDFFLIFKEALNNAAKYSKATKVQVAVGIEGRLLSFMIKDNGTGFDIAKADSGNGLGNMQKRADAVNGKLKITSKQGEGTTVKLTIPVG